MQLFNPLRRVSILLLAFGALVPFCPAQEALRDAVQVDRALEKRQRGLQIPAGAPDGLRWGPLQFAVGLSYALEFDDNVNASEVDPDSDIGNRFGINLSTLWPITERSRLGFGVGLSYLKYVQDSDQDRFDLSPDTALAYDLQAKDFLFTFYDRASYSQDVGSEPAVSGTTEYPQFENTAGLRISWVPNEWVYSVGYSHNNFISSDEEFSEQSRSAEQLFGRVAYRFAPRTQAGIEATGALTDYTETNRESTTFSLGPFIDWQATEAIRLTARGGYVYYSFETTAIYTNVPVFPTTVVTNNRSDTVSSYYVGLTAEHQLTRHITHGVSAVRQIRAGVNEGGDYVQDNTVSYNLGWAFHRNIRASTSVSYIWGIESLFTLEGEADEEEFRQFDFGAALSWSITQKLTSDLGYTLTVRESNLPLRGYRRNLVSLGLRYRF